MKPEYVKFAKKKTDGNSWSSRLLCDFQEEPVHCSIAIF